MHPEQSGFTDGGSFVADVGPGRAPPLDGFANGEHRRTPPGAFVAKDRGFIPADPTVRLRPLANRAWDAVPPLIVLRRHVPARAGLLDGLLP